MGEEREVEEEVGAEGQLEEELEGRWRSTTVQEEEVPRIWAEAAGMVVAEVEGTLAAEEEGTLAVGEEGSSMVVAEEGMAVVREGTGVRAAKLAGRGAAAAGRIGSYLWRRRGPQW